MPDAMTILRARVSLARVRTEKAAFLGWLWNRRQPPVQPQAEQDDPQNRGRLRQRWTDSAKGMLSHLFKRFDRTYYSGGSEP